MSYLGIDVGTTGTKAVGFDKNGKMISIAYREYKTISPQPGWFELDAREVITSCKQVIKEVAYNLKNLDPVVAIGISSQGEAFTLLDKHNNYLCNIMVSFDNRSQKQVNDFTACFGKQKLYQITGHSSHTIFSLFKLLWIKENKPDVFNKTNKFLCCADLLAYELTGQAVTSYNLAARTMLFDVKNLQWSQEILEKVGIDKSALPNAVASYEAVGALKAKLAKELLMGKDVVVAAGGHDQSCGALGVGVTGPGFAAYSLGTVECITPAFSQCVIGRTMEKSNLATYPYTLDGLYTTVAFNLTAGSLLRWFRDTLGDCEKELAKKRGCDVYDLVLKDIPDEPTKLFVQPHFASTGTPYFDPNPTGAIIGLTLNSTKTDIAKAIIEGVTYEMKLNMELLKSAGIEIKKLRAFGGGTKNKKSLQIKADILGVPIDVLEVNEAGCLGAALLAAKARGDIYDLRTAASKWSKPQRTYTPKKDNVEKYQKRYEIYSKIYDSLKPLGIKINAL